MDDSQIEKRDQECDEHPPRDLAQQWPDDYTDQGVDGGDQQVGGNVARPLPGVEDGRGNPPHGGRRDDDGGYGDHAQSGSQHHASAVAGQPQASVPAGSIDHYEHPNQCSQRTDADRGGHRSGVYLGTDDCSN